MRINLSLEFDENARLNIWLVFVFKRTYSYNEKPDQQ